MSRKRGKGTIAFDLDDVLYSYDVISRTLEEHGVDPASVTTWEMTEAPQNVVNIIRERFRDAKYMCNPVGLMPDAILAIKKIIKLGYRCIVVSSRAPEIASQTRIMIKKVLPDISGIFLVGIGGSKVEILKRQCCHLLIDDGPHNIQDAMAAGINCILISNRKTLHNHQFADQLRQTNRKKTIAPSLTVIANWLAAADRKEKKEKKRNRKS